MTKNIHVFSGTFADRDAACRYSEPQWEPELDESASDEEIAAWEERNPTCPMQADLGLEYLNCDFIETIDSDERFEYLGTLLAEADAPQRIREMAGAGDNILVLIFTEAFFDEIDEELKSTSRLKYCGAFVRKD